MAAKKGAKKDKKEKKSPKGSSKASSAASTPVKESPKEEVKSSAPEGSLDFEAGIIFNKYDKSGAGVLTAEEFRKVWREAKEQMSKGNSAGNMMPGMSNTPGSVGSESSSLNPERKLSYGSSDGGIGGLSFEAGKVFAKFDGDNDGRINKDEFENIVRNHPELLKGSAPPPPPQGTLPVEVISGRLLTHFDETAGVPIPKQAVDEHRSMGNSVTPLVEAYRARYDRLRNMLTSKLLPRREHILQLRRQLKNTAGEVAATKNAIERETRTDADQIIERLRSVESMRQSAITHQTLALDEELQAIERTVRRVEQANDTKTRNATQVGGGISLVTTSAAVGSTAVESVRAPQAALMVEVIQQFNDLQSEIEKLSSKQLEVQVEFPSDDFPKETSDRLEIIARCDRYAHALSVKDHMLWTALQEKSKLEEQLTEERNLSAEYAAEVTRWAEMSQSLAQQILALKEGKVDEENKVNSLLNILRDHNIHVAP